MGVFDSRLPAPCNRAGSIHIGKEENAVKRTFQRAQPDAGGAGSPWPFCPGRDAKEALDRLKEEQERIEEQIEQAGQRREDAATLKTLYQQKANSILAQLDALNGQISQQRDEVEKANEALAQAQRAR